MIINNSNPSNNTVSFIDGNSEKKSNNNSSIKKNKEFVQIYPNNNKNINFVKAKYNISKNVTEKDAINKIKNITKTDKKDKKEIKTDDINNKNKIKKYFKILIQIILIK